MSVGKSVAFVTAGSGWCGAESRSRQALRLATTKIKTTGLGSVQSFGFKSWGDLVFESTES